MNLKFLYNKLNLFKKKYGIDRNKIKKKRINNVPLKMNRFIDREIYDYIINNI